VSAHANYPAYIMKLHLYWPECPGPAAASVSCNRGSHPAAGNIMMGYVAMLRKE